MAVNQPDTERVVILEVPRHVLRRQSRRSIAEVEWLYARAREAEARIGKVVGQQRCLIDFRTVPINFGFVWV